MQLHFLTIKIEIFREILLNWSLKPIKNFLSGLKNFQWMPRDVELDPGDLKLEGIFVIYLWFVFQKFFWCKICWNITYSRFGGRDHRVQYSGNSNTSGGQYRQCAGSYGQSNNQWNQQQRTVRAPPQQVIFYLVLVLFFHDKFFLLFICFLLIFNYLLIILIIF